MSSRPLFKLTALSLADGGYPPPCHPLLFDQSYTGLMSLAIPLGLFVAGPIAEIIGVAAWFFVSGVLIVLTAMLGYVLIRKVTYNTP
ncbi:MAG: hypothetical protein AB1796_11730 [Bacillota bacterium]